MAHEAMSAGAAPPDPVNRVRLRGKVTTAAEQRELPSGAVVVSVRLSVAREPSPMTTGSRQTTDWVDCSAWGAKVRRSVASWRTGDVVEVEGALRRRFSRATSGPSTRLEVEVLGARRVHRPDPPQRRRGSRMSDAGVPGES
jgi:single-strand DNA-binding protein